MPTSTVPLFGATPPHVSVAGGPGAVFAETYAALPATIPAAATALITSVAGGQGPASVIEYRSPVTVAFSPDVPASWERRIGGMLVHTNPPAPAAGERITRTAVTAPVQMIAQTRHTPFAAGTEVDMSFTKTFTVRLLSRPVTAWTYTSPFVGLVADVTIGGFGAADVTAATELATWTHTFTGVDTVPFGVAGDTYDTTVTFDLPSGGDFLLTLSIDEAFAATDPLQPLVPTLNGVSASFTAQMAMIDLDTGASNASWVYEDIAACPPLMARAVARGDAAGVPPLYARGRSPRQERLYARGPL